MSNIPGLSQEVRNLRRPLATNAYYSCSQQDWDALCRQTLVPASRPRATAALVKKSRAGKIHETADGEAALARCSACTQGNNGNGYPCYLSSNGTTKSCAHCAYSNKSKCDAQRAPAAAANPAPPLPAAIHPALLPPSAVAAQATYPAFAPPVQQFVPGPANNVGRAPVAAHQPLPPREWTDEDLKNLLTEEEFLELFHSLRRDHENQRQ
ncbi:hypothetical protein KCU85_g1547, partial [Aureobasidium melanogenum]